MYQPLLDYIKQARAAGMKDSQIRQELLKVNWGREHIDEAFKSLGGVNKTISLKIIIFIVLGVLLVGFVAFGFWYGRKYFNQGTTDNNAQKESVALPAPSQAPPKESLPPTTTEFTVASSSPSATINSTTTPTGL